MTRVSVAIMAHPRRQHHVERYLLPRLDVDAAVVWDRHGDRWDTGRRALLAYDDSADYHVVIQDDALVSARLAAGVAALVDHVPARAPIGLYYGSIRPARPHIDRPWREAVAQDACWIALHQSPMWGVGLALPVADLAAVVADGDARPEVPNYDRRIAHSYHDAGRLQYFPVPSLVDHAGDPSLIPGRTGKRRIAYSFLGEDVCAADRDWTGPVVVDQPRPTSTDRRHGRRHPHAV